MDEMRDRRAGSSDNGPYYAIAVGTCLLLLNVVMWAMAGADAVAQAAPLAVAPATLEAVAAPTPPVTPAPPVAPHLRDRKYDLGTRTYGNWSVS